MSWSSRMSVFYFPLNTGKSMIFLCTISEQTENEIKKMISLIIDIKRIKHFRYKCNQMSIILTHWKLQNTPERWWYSPQINIKTLCSWIRRLHIGRTPRTKPKVQSNSQSQLKLHLFTEMVIHADASADGISRDPKQSKQSWKWRTTLEKSNFLI